MSLEIGPTPITPGSRAPVRPSAPAAPGFAATLASAAPVDAAEVAVPAFPPPAVLDDVAAAADRAEQLAADRRELHFALDDTTGRVVVQVRDLTTGEVIRTIPPSKALAVMAGEAL